MASFSVEAAIKTCIERLGYSEVKKEQEEAIIKFVIEREDVFCVYLLGLARVCATIAYQFYLTSWLEGVHHGHQL